MLVFFYSILQTFVKAVEDKFSSIETNAMCKNLRSWSSKSRKVNDGLNIRNEIKIITSDDSTGKVIDLVSTKKFKEFKEWKPERDKDINREFFKFMGNMSPKDHCKLALHLLNHLGEKRRHMYPKVTMKKVNSVLDSYYKAKDYIGRRKRKQLVPKELHRLNLRLNLLSSIREFWLEN